jgi:hypothetical protein
VGEHLTYNGQQKCIQGFFETLKKRASWNLGIRRKVILKRKGLKK